MTVKSFIILAPDCLQIEFDKFFGQIFELVCLFDQLQHLSIDLRQVGRNFCSTVGVRLVDGRKLPFVERSQTLPTGCLRRIYLDGPLVSLEGYTRNFLTSSYVHYLNDRTLPVLNDYTS
jgi:hypothetical protein